MPWGRAAWGRAWGPGFVTAMRRTSGDLAHVSELLAVPIDGRLAVVFIALMVAALLRGFVGFGAALISVPLFSLVLAPHAAIAVNNVRLPAVFQLLPEAIRRAERNVVVPICMAIFASAPIGTWALVSTDPAVMTVAISTLVLLMVAILASGWRLMAAHGGSEDALASPNS